MEGKKVNKLYLYYDGTIEMTSKEYLPYLLFAIFMLIAFNVLCLHYTPFNVFRRFLITVVLVTAVNYH